MKAERDTPRSEKFHKMRLSSQTPEPTVFDLMDATGEQIFGIEGINNIRHYSSRKLLRISAKWANAVKMERETLLQEGGIVDDSDDKKLVYDLHDEELKKIVSTLTPDCALLEVKAISFLSSIGGQSSLIANNNNSYEYADDDDDGTSSELENLERTTKALEVELKSQEILFCQ